MNRGLANLDLVWERRDGPPQPPTATAIHGLSSAAFILSTTSSAVIWPYMKLAK